MAPFSITPSSLPTSTRTKKFYCEVLGLEERRPPAARLSRRSGSIPAASPPCICWARASRARASSCAAPKKKFKDTGRFDHIAFAASDLPSVRKRLKSKKVKFREQIVPRTGAAQIFLYDPDGVGVELNFPPEEMKA